MYLKIKKKLKNDNFVKYFNNSFWMLLEQMLRIVSGVFVGIYIARFLGPEDFGILSYAMIISVFLMAIARLGMDSILVREISSLHDSDINQQSRYLSTAFWIMSITSAISYILLSSTLYFINSDSGVSLIILIVSFSVIFTPFLSIDYFFQSQIKSKLSALCKILTMVVMSITKLLLIYYEADLIYFAFAAFFDHLMLALFLVFIGKASKDIKMFSFFETNIVKSIWKSSFYMVVAAIAVTINMRVDQFMITHYLGFEKAGIYSSAVKFYESWAVLPQVITISLLPLIIKAKSQSVDLYEQRLCYLIRGVFYLSLFVSILVSFFSKELVLVTFGNAYSEAAAIVPIVMWASVFVAVGSVSTRYLTVEKMEKKILYRTLFTTMVNIILNFTFIPIYGIFGAAVTTLFCVLLSSYLLDFLDKDLFGLIKIKHKAILFK